MLNIVIIGAGDIGRHLAELLSKSRHNVIVVDKDDAKLKKLSGEIDIATRLGSGTDWKLLDALLEFNPNILLAVTQSDETNLVSCSIAKHLGYPSSIARVRDNHFLNRNRLDFARVFDVDHFLAPELLCAYDLLRYMESDGALRVENFNNGTVQLRVIKIPSNWRKSEVSLRDLVLPDGVMIGLIKRDDENRDVDLFHEPKIIFPHGDDTVIPGDEVTFIGEADGMEELNAFLGLDSHEIESVVVVGGSLVGINLARLLEKRDVKVRLIEKDYDKCLRIADEFPQITVINHDVADREFLRSEKIAEADVVAFCTNQDETNLLGAMLVKELGSKEVVVILTNNSFQSLTGTLGINHVGSPRFSASSKVLSQILSGTVTSLISLYENRAEVMEVTVSADSRLVGIPLSELGRLMPRDFLFAMIQNRGRIMVANGSRVISPGDTVILITDPQYIPEIEKLF